MAIDEFLLRGHKKMSPLKFTLTETGKRSHLKYAGSVMTLCHRKSTPFPAPINNANDGDFGLCRICRSKRDRIAGARAQVVTVDSTTASWKQIEGTTSWGTVDHP